VRTIYLNLTDSNGKDILSRHLNVSQVVTKDFPDLQLHSGLDVIAGLLYVSLSSGGKDFIAFLRKGQLCEVHWAGRQKEGGTSSLEPRTSFRISLPGIMKASNGEVSVARSGRKKWQGDVVLG
jgi:light-regulated signal transduction histidine kinase (bacteriophytochrome)